MVPNFDEPFPPSGVSLAGSSMETDEALIHRVRAGDMAAFDRLYERYEVRLFAYVRGLVRDRQDAEEIFHDAFLAALKDATSAFDDGGFRAWLYRVARNLSLNRVRASGRHARRVEQAAVEENFVARADEELESRELGAALGVAVERLPPVLGELYHLRSSGLSYEQIAGVVDVPLGTVKSRMHQLVQTLRKELEPWTAPE
jgi:RNA polymerase sigma-70 factor (ECF subfamily)